MGTQGRFPVESLLERATSRVSERSDSDKLLKERSNSDSGIETRKGAKRAPGFTQHRSTVLKESALHAIRAVMGASKESSNLCHMVPAQPAVGRARWSARGSLNPKGFRRVLHGVSFAGIPGEVRRSSWDWRTTRSVSPFRQTSFD